MPEQIPHPDSDIEDIRYTCDKPNCWGEVKATHDVPRMDNAKQMVYKPHLCDKCGKRYEFGSMSYPGKRPTPSPSVLHSNGSNTQSLNELKDLKDLVVAKKELTSLIVDAVHGDASEESKKEKVGRAMKHWLEKQEIEKYTLSLV